MELQEIVNFSEVSGNTTHGGNKQRNVSCS